MASLVIKVLVLAFDEKKVSFYFLERISFGILSNVVLVKCLKHDSPLEKSLGIGRFLV